ncbi:MipA/OmpV family protein [Veronia pacifica]|uniref:MipA/OmpV family protein n=1 Tax=Veronia pacifica TaxID=1080227 RepID=A0A1C3ECL3_9GAMM|nr:MipA/OmpV family protein [Veronia pacifica]ODA30950.1 hypothetical protein A8L45_18625 [Veronia pacifica]
MKKFGVLLVGAMSMASVPSYAFFEKPEDGKFYDYGFIGVSAVADKSVYSADNKAKFRLSPSTFYNGEFGFVEGTLFNVSVLPYVGLSGNWRFAEVSEDVTTLPKGIKERDASGELGVTFGTVGARITLLHDVTSQHDGYELQLYLARAFELPIDGLSISPFVGADFRDKKLSNHLYGISAAEAAASGLKAFTESNTRSFKTGITGLYEVFPNWNILGKVKLNYHDTESPLVRQRFGIATSLGVVYSFGD